MEDILDHINCFEGLYKKRNRIAYGYNERRVLHKWIANYFWLNTKGIDFQIDPSNQLQIENNINFEFKLLEIGYDLDFDKVNNIFVFNFRPH